MGFDNTGQIPQGSTVVRPLAGGSAFKYVRKITTQPGSGSRYFRGYYQSTRDAHDFWQVQFIGTISAKLRFKNDGTVALYDGDSTLRATSTKAFAANEWFRYEVRLNANTGEMTLRLFWGPALHDALLATQPDYTEQHTSLVWSEVGYDTIYYGDLNEIWPALNFGIDAVATDVTDWIGPTTVGTVRTFVSDADTASATESQSLAKNSSDSATATEAASVARATTTGDTASATENQSVNTGSSISSSDTASATEAASLAVAQTSADSATATEAASVTVARASSDSASATEAASLAVAATSSDAASAAQAASLAVTVSNGDTATGSDAESLDTSNHVSSADTATASDTLSARAITASESATATDAVSARAFSSGDAGSATDAVTAGLRATTAGDTASAVEAVTARQSAAGDTASAVETASVSVSITSADTATATEGATVSQARTSSDSAAATEQVVSLSISNSVTSSDTASTAEAAFLALAITSADAATATEQVVTIGFDARNVTVYYGKGVHPRYATGVSRAGATVVGVPRSGAAVQQDQTGRSVQSRHAEAVP
jgi:hypothetical protein